MTEQSSAPTESSGERSPMPPVIKAAWIVFAGLILAGLMVWQPWVSPTYERVDTGPSQAVFCMTYKFSVDCGK